MVMLENVKVTVTDVGGTYRDVANAARTTINMAEGDKEISEEYMYKMYKCEHSPIRLRQFRIVIENCPSWVATHFCRHHIGVEKFVSTQRTDRTGVDRNKLPQDAPVRLEMWANAQAMINISRKRLCNCASKETREVWQMVLEEVKKIDSPLYEVCVRECIYRNHCPEYKSCGYDKTKSFKEEVERYHGGMERY